MGMMQDECLDVMMKPQMTMRDVVTVLKAKTGRGSEGTVKMLWNTGQLAYKVRRPVSADRNFERDGHVVRGTRYSTPADVAAYLKRMNLW